jgi:hypothetical protein
MKEKTPKGNQFSFENDNNLLKDRPICYSKTANPEEL